MAAEKDVDLIVRNRWFPSGAGVMVEVGAAKPDYLSIGASFRDAGWQVIAIEPNPIFCEEHRSRGHEIFQFACSDKDENDVDFFVVDSKEAEYLDGQVSFESFSSLGLSKEFEADLQRSKVNPTVGTIKVDVRKLDTILAQNYPALRKVDLVAIDVEGWELSVMRGFNTSLYRPAVVILENLFKSKTYPAFMKKLGYRRWTRLKPNEVYVRQDLLPNVAVRMLRRIMGQTA